MNVVVVTDGGRSHTTRRDHYTFVAAPSISRLSSTSGPVAGGPRIDIVGQHFDHASTVTFGRTRARSWRVVSSREISVVVPSHGESSVNVRVGGPGGTSAIRAGDRYRYIARPTVSGVADDEGRLDGGDRVEIRGHDFVGSIRVAFGSVAAAAVTVLSSTTLLATSPPGAALGPVDVTVRTRYGSSPSSPADRFAYVSAPSAPTVTAEVAPAPTGQQIHMTGTGCSSAACYAVGYYDSDSDTVPVIEQRSGTQWVRNTVQVPDDRDQSGLFAEFDSVSCSVNSCVAVGRYLAVRSAHDYVAPFSEVLGSTGWSVAATRGPAPATDSWLNHVSCGGSSSVCIALGGYEDSDGHTHPAMAVLNAGSGALWGVPAPAGAGSGSVEVSDAACGSASFCTVAGWVDGTFIHPFVDTFAHDVVTSRSVPLPAGSSDGAFLLGVACPGSTTCVAVGRRPTATGSRPFAVVDDAGVLTGQDTPLPADADADVGGALTGVACVAARCTAVGYYSAGGEGDGLTETLAGQAWTATAEQPSSGYSSRTSTAVACVDSRRCFEGGSQNMSSTNVASASVHGPGGFADATVPQAQGQTTAATEVDDVSCRSAGECVGVEPFDSDAGGSILLDASFT